MATNQQYLQHLLGIKAQAERALTWPMLSAKDWQAYDKNRERLLKEKLDRKRLEPRDD
jgi:hypothetical protein